MKVFVLIALLSAALAPHSIAAVVASKAGVPHCKKDAPDTVPYVKSSYEMPKFEVKKVNVAGKATS